MPLSISWVRLAKEVSCATPYTSSGQLPKEGACVWTSQEPGGFCRQQVSYAFGDRNDKLLINNTFGA